MMKYLQIIGLLLNLVGTILLAYSVRIKYDKEFGAFIFNLRPALFYLGISLLALGFILQIIYLL